MRVNGRRSPLFRGEWEYVDQKTGRIYQRVVGALAWPGSGPGFAVVVAEELVRRPPAPAYLIAEVEAQHAGELIAQCAELGRDCAVAAWYGRTDDRESMDFLSFYNREAALRREPAFTLRSAPYSDGGRISYHLNILLSRLKAGDKTLHLYEESGLPGFLMEVQAADMVRARADDFPAVAALGYAVAALSVYERKEIEFPEAAPQWDPNDFI